MMQTLKRACILKKLSPKWYRRRNQTEPPGNSVRFVEKLYPPSKYSRFEYKIIFFQVFINLYHITGSAWKCIWERIRERSLLVVDIAKRLSGQLKILKFTNVCTREKNLYYAAPAGRLSLSPPVWSLTWGCTPGKCHTNAHYVRPVSELLDTCSTT